MTEFDRFRLEQAQADFTADVVAYYRAFGSLKGIRQQFRSRRVRGSEARDEQSPSRPRPNPPPPRAPLPPFVLVDTAGNVLLPAQGHRPGERISRRKLARTVPLEVDGITIARILNLAEGRVRNPQEALFLSRINRALFMAAAGATILALILGVLLTRTLTKPLRELTTATQAMAKGELEQQVPVRTQDELGQLAASFNQMSQDLAKSNRLRRQMTADIAHDLRSPLAVIVGYLESLRDGILKPEPAMFEVMYAEATHLEQLVEDLRTLSLADAGELPLNRQTIATSDLLERAVKAYHHQAEQQSIGLYLQTRSTLPLLVIDSERMMRVLGNLISNALQHTPHGGRITLSAQAHGDTVQLSVEDSGVGIAAEKLAQLFDRFYRVDESREQNEGGSGLGLAIAKSIVELHGGLITATSIVGRGTTFTITLPIDTENKNT